MQRVESPAGPFIFFESSIKHFIISSRRDQVIGPVEKSDEKASPQWPIFPQVCLKLFKSQRTIPVAAS